jgi:hypothetical protein
MHGERAIETRDRRVDREMARIERGIGQHRDFTLVDVIAVECPGQRAERVVGRGIDQRAGNDIGERRRVVGAVDRDRDRLGDDAAMMVVDLDRIGQRQRLAPRRDSRNSCPPPRRSRSTLPSRRRSRPSTCRARASSGWWTRPRSGPWLRRPRRHPVMVTAWVSLRSASVNVTVPDALSGFDDPVVSGLLNDGRGLRRRRDDRRIVAADDHDDHRLARDAAMVIVDLDRVGQRQRFRRQPDNRNSCPRPRRSRAVTR